MAKFLCINNSGVRALLNVDKISAIYEQRDGTIVVVCAGEVHSCEDSFTDVLPTVELLEAPVVPN